MKKNVLKWLFMMALVPLMFVMACNPDDKDDEEEVDEFLPVLNENFNFSVTGNDVMFSTTINGNVWVTTDGVDYPFVDKAVTVNLPLAGTYTFTCSSLGSGVKKTSEEFTVTIAADDLAFLNVGLWKALSGGANQSKTWKLDINSEGKLKHFAGPMYFSGYSDGDNRKTEWSYWAWDVLPSDLPYTLNGTEQTGFFNWSPDYASNSWIMAPRDYGKITFNGTSKTAVLTDITGAVTNGTFTFDTATWKMKLTGVVLPIDTSRLNEPQYTDEYLSEVRVFSLTDSAMQIGIRRTYEGRDDAGNQKVSEWVNVYNFIVDGYNYPVPEEFTFSEPVKTSITAADLVGTWEYDVIAQDWIGWTAAGDQGTNTPSKRLNSWSTRAEMATTLANWGGGNTDSLFTANDALEFEFKADGTCTLAGIANTYSVTNGKITFGTALTKEFSVVWIALTGTSVTVLDVVHDNSGAPYTYDGLWIGQKNGEKAESSAVHIVKK